VEHSEGGVSPRFAVTGGRRAKKNPALSPVRRRRARALRQIPTSALGEVGRNLAAGRPEPTSVRSNGKNPRARYPRLPTGFPGVTRLRRRRLSGLPWAERKRRERAEGTDPPRWVSVRWD
jgi:hypothetical protein